MNKLAVENIHKCYGATPVLKGVSLAARPGEVISILGSSGSGKSTFLRCINLLEQPNQGAIWLDDQEIKLRPGKHGMLRAENQRALQQLQIGKHVLALHQPIGTAKSRSDLVR